MQQNIRIRPLAEVNDLENISEGWLTCLICTPRRTILSRQPQYPLPAIVAKQLGNLCQYLSDGIIPEPIKHCARRGRPLGPDERRDVRYAVTYVLAAKQGLIRDRHPLETIVQKYRLSNRKTVQTWIVKHRKTIAAESFADPGMVEDRMKEAAGRYRVSGRHQNAIRGRASK